MSLAAVLTTEPQHPLPKSILKVVSTVSGNVENNFISKKNGPLLLSWQCLLFVISYKKDCINSKRHKQPHINPTKYSEEQF